MTFSVTCFFHRLPVTQAILHAAAFFVSLSFHSCFIVFNGIFQAITTNWRHS